jgi:single-stranded DNA-binding protein
MLTITASGYITGEPKIEDTEYGKRATVTIRSKTTNGKQTHYINAVFYGKRIETVSNYMADGRQVTIIGSVRQISGKKKKDGTDYSSIYMDASDFTLPERNNGDPDRRKPIDEEVAF